MKFPVMMNVSELRVGDVVELFDGPFSTAIVKNVKDGEITFYRPYGTDGGSPTVMSGGLILYTGLEVFNDPMRSGNKMKVWQRAK